MQNRARRRWPRLDCAAHVSGSISIAPDRSIAIFRSRAELGCRGRRRGGERERGEKTTSCPFRVTRDIFTYLSPPRCRKTKRQRGKERRGEKGVNSSVRKITRLIVFVVVERFIQESYEREKKIGLNYHNFTKATRAHMYTRILRQTYTYTHTHIHLFNFAPFAHQLV